MNGLVLAPKANSGGKHPHDATGAFQPGADAFVKHYALSKAVLFDNTKAPPKRFVELVAAVRKTSSPVDALAYFGHGLRTATQVGLTVDNAQQLATALKAVSAPRLTVCLYACSSGEDKSEVGGKTHANGPGAGDGCVADVLRDALADVGIAARVLAHATVGHSFHNPYVRMFDASTKAGGEWLVDPKSADWKLWARAMQVGDLWMRMPFMEPAAIVAEVRKA